MLFSLANGSPGTWNINWMATKIRTTKSGTAQQRRPSTILGSHSAPAAPRRKAAAAAPDDPSRGRRRRNATNARKRPPTPRTQGFFGAATLLRGSRAVVPDAHVSERVHVLEVRDHPAVVVDLGMEPLHLRPHQARHDVEVDGHHRERILEQECLGL